MTTSNFTFIIKIKSCMKGVTYPRNSLMFWNTTGTWLYFLYWPIVTKVIWKKGEQKNRYRKYSSSREAPGVWQEDQSYKYDGQLRRRSREIPCLEGTPVVISVTAHRLSLGGRGDSNTGDTGRHDIHRHIGLFDVLATDHYLGNETPCLSEKK